MSKKNNTNSTGISFAGLLTILFIGLKLTHHIDWSWWWVLSPLWIVLGLVLLIILGVWLFTIAVAYTAKRKLKKFFKERK